MKHFLKILIFVIVQLFFVIMIFFSSLASNYGCTTHPSNFGFKSYITGKSYPPLYFDPPGTDCLSFYKPIFRIPIEPFVVILMVDFLLYRFLFKKIKVIRKT